MKYASQEWLNRQAELQQAFAPRPGASARVQYRLTQAPEVGEIRYYADVQDGRVVTQTLGDDPAADGTMSSSYSDSIAMLRGELAPTAAFMEGRVKVTGDVAKLGALMPITQTAEYKRHYAQLVEETEF
ncbi:putative sterol carrier protein [Mycobacterium frederiksbergense]|uniref:Sterol carrier protein n=1 Tax=Mycolicibacterium frederiksbergense TaxID=117567 RepID=A0ABT6KVU0_9MYCO|nr:SCP2 sterol-binding domain-containing protein [Mycolicibacterium frederiksbergense]MDH6194827.1 putative sterol carrier protein [Mycolicibacterium frederiksbergense]